MWELEDFFKGTKLLQIINNNKIYRISTCDLEVHFLQIVYYINTFHSIRTCLFLWVWTWKKDMIIKHFYTYHVNIAISVFLNTEDLNEKINLLIKSINRLYIILNNLQLPRKQIPPKQICKDFFLMKYNIITQIVFPENSITSCLERIF